MKHSMFLLLSFLFALQLNAQLLPYKDEALHKWGYKDIYGKVVIPAKFKHADSFAEGLAAVYDGKLYGYIDTLGKLVIPYKFKMSGTFSEGLAAVCVKSANLWGYINKKGNVVIPDKYYYAEMFTGGYATIQCEAENTATHNYAKLGVIDKQGKIIIPCEWESIGIINNGLFAVKNPKTTLWGYMNAKAVLVIPCLYDEAYNFEAGKALVNLGEESFYIDATGKRME